MTLRPSARSRAKARAKLDEPGRAEWKTPPSTGKCEGCGSRGPRIRHHVFREQDVRREGGDPWDQANAMLLGLPFVCSCHSWHHEPSGRRRLPLRKVPTAAIEFGVRLMGEDRAHDYLATHYSVASYPAGGS